MSDPTTGREPLDERTVDRDPVVQFGRWFHDAEAHLSMPEAMALATSDANGRPGLRMVLLKAWGPAGFVFYTNYESRKSGEIDGNPRAALLFYWESRGRQVRIEGRVERVTPEESDAYFATRPASSRLGARASRQSRSIADRSRLEAQVEGVRREFGDEVPRPVWWGGYRVVPDAFEFWEQRPDRLHDRVAYRFEGGTWQIGRLQP